MTVPHKIIAGLLVLLTCVCAHAQESRIGQPGDSLMVYFRQGSAVFEPGYMDNEARFNQFIEHIKNLQSNDMFSIYRVEYIGHASPEGSGILNESLARRRAANFTRHLHKKLEFADSVVFVSSVSEDWEGLDRLITDDPDLPNREQVLPIVRDESLGVYRERELKEKYPQAWKYMLNKHFPALRNFKVFIYIGLSNPVELPVLEEIYEDFAEEIIIPVEFGELDTTLSVEPMAVPWMQEMAVKTNGLGWGLGHQNVALEIDLAPHWSISVPFYYSGGFDYFKSTLKFRGIVLQPEVRYFPRLKKNRNDGWYIGAHAGLGWYNFALGGEYRIQDYKGNRPAWGGGIGAGYTMQFATNPRWGLEFALGAGVYDVMYDIFYNEHNGPYAERGVHDTFFGIDNASVAVTYKFHVKRKEGKR